MIYYKEHLENNRGLSEYSFDGAINLNQWVHSEPKILFLLKENWGYQGCGIINTSDLAHGWLDATNTKTYKRLTVLSACVHTSLKKGQYLSQKEIRDIGNNRALLHEVLDSIAVVNIKKHSGLSKSDDREIRQEAKRNSVLLKKQISDLNPDIIIAGSNVCWDALVYDLGLFEDTPKCPKHHAIKHEQYILCYTNHPSAWSGGGFPIGDLHAEIIKNK